jgi:hypothetical protein
VETAAAPLLEKTTALVQQALTVAGVVAPSLRAVEVVGGAARMPAMKDALERCLGRELNFTMDGSLALAVGAALAVRPSTVPKALTKVSNHLCSGTASERRRGRACGGLRECGCCCRCTERVGAGARRTLRLEREH